jgi:hypothetical protein
VIVLQSQPFDADNPPSQPNPARKRWPVWINIAMGRLSTASAPRTRAPPWASTTSKPWSSGNCMLSCPIPCTHTVSQLGSLGGRIEDAPRKILHPSPRLDKRSLTCLLF